LSPQKPISSISTCKDIVQCAFSLNDFEVEVFRSAFKQGPMRADELADLMGVERSKVYRALQKLLSCGMCIRETRSLEKGGYYHVYSTIDRDVLRSKIERCIGEWNERMRDAMARFDERSANDIV